MGYSELRRPNEKVTDLGHTRTLDRQGGGEIRELLPQPLFRPVCAQPQFLRVQGHHRYLVGSREVAIRQGTRAAYQHAGGVSQVQQIGEGELSGCEVCRRLELKADRGRRRRTRGALPAEMMDDELLDLQISIADGALRQVEKIEWRDRNLGESEGAGQQRVTRGRVEIDRLQTDALRVTEHPDFALAVPTPDHFLPLLYLAGLAAAGGNEVEPLVRGYSMGSISMSCYGLGAELELRKDATCAARLPPGVPPEESNI